MSGVNGLLVLQLAAIYAACAALAAALKPLRQPASVAHMAAGVLLGPSFFGLLAPGVHAALFPPTSLPALRLLGRAAVALYMLGVGLDFEPPTAKRLRAAGLVSAAGLAAPLTLGAALGLAYAGDPRLFGAGVSAWRGALFVGGALSITAFPVLARILEELGLTRAPAGVLSLTAAFVGDLAAVIALGAVAAGSSSGGRLDLAAVAVAFVAGSVVPRAAAAKARRFLAPFSAALLPVYLAYSGLNTSLGALAAPDLALFALLAFAAACAGKLGGCYAAARLGGESRRDAFLVGALMNSRGLMELIVVNAGRDLGLLTPALYSILVLMALATTLSSGPLAAWARTAPATVPRPSSARAR